MNLLKRLSTPLLLSALSLTLASFIGSSISIEAQADEIVIPVGQQGADKASLDKPKTGMKAEAVEKKFGAPLQKSTPIGKPPISKWEYPHYYVYFESDRVINTVLKPYSEEIASPSTPTTPAVVAEPVKTEPATTPAPVVTEPSASESVAPEQDLTPEVKDETVDPEPANKDADSGAKDEVDPAEKVDEAK